MDLIALTLEQAKKLATANNISIDIVYLGEIEEAAEDSQWRVVKEKLVNDKKTLYVMMQI